jgi:hypothetical protein
MGTGLVRLLHFMAIGTLAQRRLGQKVVRPPRAGPSLRVPPFWVRHCNTPRFRLVWADCMGFSPEKLSLKLHRRFCEEKISRFDLETAKTHILCKRLKMPEITVF